MTMVEISREQFLEQRRKGIGGSDAAAIVGMSPFDTALDIYNQKLALVAPKPQTPAMLRGTYLESVAVDLFCAITGKKVRRQPQRVHASYPFILGNIDRQILARNGEDDTMPAHLNGTGLLEVKCPGIRTFLRYQREGLPAHIICQGQHYLGVYDYDWMSFALFNADLWKLIHFEIARDDAFIEGLFEAECRFWHEHVEKQVPPSEKGMLHLALPDVELPEVEGAIVTREDPAFLDAVETFKQARSLREIAEAVEESAIARLKEVAGECGVYEGGNLRFYWKEQAGKKSFDRKALEGLRPLDPIRVATHIDSFTMTETLHSALLDGLEACRVDFAQYEKVGRPFETFRPYLLKPQGAEDE